MFGGSLWTGHLMSLVLCHDWDVNLLKFSRFVFLLPHPKKRAGYDDLWLCRLTWHIIYIYTHCIYYCSHLQSYCPEGWYGKQNDTTNQMIYFFCGWKTRPHASRNLGTTTAQRFINIINVVKPLINHPITSTKINRPWLGAITSHPK